MFVGDTVWDMKAAVRDAVVPVAVLSGGIPRADLESAGAHAVYQDPPTSSDVWTPASSPNRSDPVLRRYRVSGWCVRNRPGS